MELLDRYLKAVSKGLPEEQRADIINELSEDIRSEMEDQEAELRRPLTEGEQQAILKRHGNPLLLAARYRHDDRTLTIGWQLVGPALFPFYVKVLSFNLGLTFIVVATIFIALAISGQKISFQDISSTVLLQMFIQLSIVTLIFSLIQKHLNNHPDKWSLGGIGGVHLDLKIEKKIHLRTGVDNQVSRFESLSIIVASAVALVWLAEVQRHPFLIFGPAAYFLKLAPIWYQVYPAIVLLTFIGMARAAINLFRPDWTRFRAISQILIETAGSGIVFLLLKAGTWVVLAEPTASHATDYSRALAIVNQCIFYGLMVGAVISVTQVALTVVRLVRSRRNSPATSSLDHVSERN